MKNVSQVSVLSLNCQFDMHYERIYRFLKENAFDVYCFQELPEDQVEKIAAAVGSSQYVFSRNIKGTLSQPHLWIGNGLFVSDTIAGSVVSSPASVYYRNRHPNPSIRSKNQSPLYFARAFWRSFEHVSLLLNGRGVQVGTTHFTWSPLCDVTNRYQRADSKRLNALMTSSEQSLSCGDFNVSKVNASYPALSRGLVNHLPDTITHTLDPELHPASLSESYDIAVDTFFSHGDVQVSDFKIYSGLSDHQGISVVAR